MKKTALALIFVLLALLLVGVQYVKVAKANFGPAPTVTVIYIKADGSIEPPNVPIKRVGNVYTLTENMLYTSSYYSLIIQCNNIEFDGAGHTIQSHSSESPAAIYIQNMNNVTIKNVSVITTSYGIIARNSHHITCITNNITSASEGLLLTNCSESKVSQNSFNDNYGIAVWIRESVNSNVTQNAINWLKGNTYSSIGIYLYDSSGCIIGGNNISMSTRGIYFRSSSNNFIYLNNFIANEQPVYDEAYSAASYPEDLFSISFSVNIWDNGIFGNYWSKYDGTDKNNDGKGDTPYIIDEENRDCYPLMMPYGTFPLPTPTASPEPTPESISSALVIGSVVAVVAVVVGLGLLVYLKKRHRLKNA